VVITADRRRLNAWLVYLGAPISMTGIQLITPTLPAMADALTLTDSQLALISTFYLLPAALGAIPAGVLADRIGRRRVFGYSMIAFGIIGLLLPLAAGNFTIFLGFRLLQGVAFAGLMPLTMTILGDIFDGPKLVQAQGRRSVSMSLADGLLPVIGGLLVAFGWFFPWFLQGLAIPFGIVVLRLMTDVSDDREAKVGGLRNALSPELWKKWSIWALQYMGFARLWIKFTLLTFLPVLIISERGGTAAMAGLTLGLSALANAVVAASGGRIARHWKPTGWMTLAITLMTIGLVVIPLAESLTVIVAAAIFYGAADGLLGIFLNALVTAVPESGHRAAFVAATGAIRNLGKFFAPTVFGLMLLVIAVPEAFLVIALVAALSIPVPWMFRSLAPRLAGGS
jgi:MFS family permease